MGLSVSDFTIDNASGQAVRLDIQACFKALQGQNAESADSDMASSQCVAGMLFLNTTSKVLKVRNSSNGDFTDIGNIDQDNLGLLSKAGGTMTGPLLIDDSSSESTPALSFDTNTNLGLFRKGANQMGFSSSGTEQLFMDGNGLTLNNQKSLRFSEPTSAGSQYVEVKAPATLASNLTLTLPSTTPTAESTVSAGAGLALIAIDESGALGWGTAGGGAEGGGNDEIFWENDQTVTQNYEITNGKNAGSFGPIEIQGGVTVTVGAGESWTIV